MRFDPVTSRRNIQMGYYDTMRQLKGLPGRLYYFSSSADGFAAFSALPEEAIRSAAVLLRLPEGFPPAAPCSSTSPRLPPSCGSRGAG